MNYFIFFFIKTAPFNIISNFFIPANIKNNMHQHKTRFSSSGNFYVKTSRLNHMLNQNREPFARFGPKLWNSLQNEVRQLPKHALKTHPKCVISIIEEEDQVEVSILPKKIQSLKT